MAVSKSLLTAALLLCAGVWEVSCAGTAVTVGPTKSGNEGKEFFNWVGKAIPELTLKTVSCLKRNDKELRETITALMSETGRCFDDAKGSISVTVECLLTNSVARILSTMGTAQKVARCALKKASDSRLCLSVTPAGDQTCPLAIGL